MTLTQHLGIRCESSLTRTRGTQGARWGIVLGAGYRIFGH
jgi:hypothetical protein